MLVGDVQGNAGRVVATARRARNEHAADLVLFPELTLSGYPPEDLLFHRGFRRQIDAALASVRTKVGDAAAIFGYPEYFGENTGTYLYDSAAFIADGAVAATHRKSELPNYKVFDEKRYFRAGTLPTVFERSGFRIGLLVCEDIWEPEPAQLTRGS